MNVTKLTVPDAEKPVAVSERSVRKKCSRLAIECAKIDANEEIKMAEEGIVLDMKQWPEF